jgi:glycosyltransferase involved in cell wall biosynthesis
VPTTFEPAGIVFLEAAAAGIPCIGPSRGGAAYLIGPGGVTVDPTDATALSAAMRSMCDPAAAAAAGRAASERAPLFTWPKVAARIMAAAGLREWPSDEGLFGTTNADRSFESAQEQWS